VSLAAGVAKIVINSFVNAWKQGVWPAERRPGWRPDRFLFGGGAETG